jgi:hypothetical protein
VNFLKIASQGQADTINRMLRVKALWSPYYLTKVVLGYTELVDHLHLHDSEAFINRWINGARRQFIEWPRGFFKSTNYTIGTGIWIVLPVSEEDSDFAIEHLKIPEDQWFQRMALHNQDATQLYAFETHRNAQKKVAEVKWHFEENSLFRHLFPEIAYQGSERPWNTDCIKIRRATDAGRRVEEGTFEAIGAGEALQSRHYDVVWEDDLVGKRATESEAEMEKIIRWHGLLNGAFVDAAKQIRFGVSNRWGYNDLNSWIRKNEPEFIFYTRRAWEVDEVSGVEIPIFPERYTIDSLLEIKKSMSDYDFSCQYLNSPQLPGESEFGSLDAMHQFRLENGVCVCSCGARWALTQCLRYIHFDPYNAKGVRSKSRPAIPVVATSPDRHIFLVDYFIGKENYEAIYERIFRFNDVYRPYMFTYEDVSGQNMCQFHISQISRSAEYKAKHRNFPMIRAVPVKNKANEIRIREFFIPMTKQAIFAYQKNQQHFIESIKTFPNATLDHDYDLLVALAQGATVWRFPKDELEENEDRNQEDAYLAKLGEPYSTIPGAIRV